MKSHAMHTTRIRGVYAHSRLETHVKSPQISAIRRIDGSKANGCHTATYTPAPRCCCATLARRRPLAVAAAAAAASPPSPLSSPLEKQQHQHHQQQPHHHQQQQQQQQQPCPPAGLRPEQLPRHIAVIMDGNSRWAAARGLPAARGHEAGVAALRRVVEAAGAWGVSALTVYALSTDNVARRPPAEVAFLYSLVEAGLAAELPALRRAGVRLRFIGARESWPRSLQRAVASAEAATSAGPGLLLTVALAYSSTDDLAAAARRLATAVAAGAMRPEDVTPAALAAALSTGSSGGGGSGGESSSSSSGRGVNSSSTSSTSSSNNGSYSSSTTTSTSTSTSSCHNSPGPVDLLIRTSGTQRLSNFLLYECAYAELLFDPSPWPAYGAPQLESALRAYAERERRFGGRGGSGGGGSDSSSGSGSMP